MTLLCYEALWERRTLVTYIARWMLVGGSVKGSRLLQTHPSRRAAAGLAECACRQTVISAARLGVVSDLFV